MTLVEGSSAILTSESVDRSPGAGFTPRVVPGLGWPGLVRDSRGLGWPVGDQTLHTDGRDPSPLARPSASTVAEAGPPLTTADVSRETRPRGVSAISDATPGNGDAVLSPQPSVSCPTTAGDGVAREAEVSAPPPPATTGSAEDDVSRETPVDTPVRTDGGSPSAVPPQRSFRTAGDLAGLDVGTDASTPLAQSVEHSILVREGRRMSPPLPRPRRTRVMVVANQKGGVGKTTTTVNLAAALAQGGLRVLVIDLDPQGNASTALAIEHHRGTPSVYDVIVDGVPMRDVVQPSPEIPGLFAIPATIDLAGAEIELVSMVAREGRLRKALHAHPAVFGADDDRFDYVLIDCPPSLGLLTLNALVAGDEMLIPIQAEYYALEGLGQLLETVEMVKAHLNDGLTVSTIILTMYDARTRLSAGVADEVRTHFADQVLRTAIPRSVRISEAPSYGQTVMTYDPGSPGALSYLEAAREVAVAGTGATPARQEEGATA